MLTDPKLIKTGEPPQDTWRFQFGLQVEPYEPAPERPGPETFDLQRLTPLATAPRDGQSIVVAWQSVPGQEGYPGVVARRASWMDWSGHGGVGYWMFEDAGSCAPGNPNLLGWDGLTSR